MPSEQTTAWSDQPITRGDAVLVAATWIACDVLWGLAKVTWRIWYG